jgi:hypothetical protein
MAQHYTVKNNNWIPGDEKDVLHYRNVAARLEACEAEEDEAGDEDGEATKDREHGYLFFSSAYCSVIRHQEMRIQRV